MATGGSPNGWCDLHNYLADLRTSQWSDGDTLNIVLTNNGTTTVNWWTVKWTFGSAQETISSIWNGQVTQTGTQVTVTNVSYDASIPPGGTVSLGFNETLSGSNPIPIVFTVNGVVASVN
jgi:hypothetical protein